MSLPARSICLIWCLFVAGCENHGPIGPPKYIQDKEASYSVLPTGISPFPTEGPLCCPVYHLAVFGDKLLAANDSAIFGSVDGTTWTPQATINARSFLTVANDVVYFEDYQSNLQFTQDFRSAPSIPNPAGGSPVQEIVESGGYIYAVNGTAHMYKSASFPVRWSRTNGELHADKLTSLAMYDGKFYALGTPSKTIYVSATAGEKWDVLSSAPKDSGDVVQLLSTPTSVSILAEHGIYTLPLDGTTWVVDTATPDQAKSYSLAQWKDRWFVGTDRGVFSAQSGQPWKQENQSMSRGYVTSLGHNASIAFAGTANGLFETKDAGEHWSDTTFPLQRGYSILSINSWGTFDFVATEKGLFRRSGEASKWEPLPILGSMKWITALDVSEKGKLCIAARANPSETQTFLFESADSGKTWKAVQTPPAAIVTSIVSIKGNTFAGTSKGVYRRFPGTETWILQNSVGPNVIIGLNKIADTKLAAIAAPFGPPPEIFYLDTFGNNNTWIKLKSTPAGVNLYVTSLWVDPNYLDILIVGTNHGPFWSTDRGNSYTQGSYFPPPVTFNTIFSMDSVPHAPTRNSPGLLLGTENGVFYLVDNVPRPGFIRGTIHNLSVFYDSYSHTAWFWVVSLFTGFLSAYLIGMAVIVVLALGGGGGIFGISWLMGLASKGLEVVPKLGRWALFLRYKSRLAKLPEVEKAGLDYFGLMAKLPNGVVTPADSTGVVLHSFVATHLKSNRCLLLTGPVGAGKSTILARLTWEFLQPKHLEIASIKYVILVPASFYKGDFFQAISNTLRDRDGIPLDTGSSLIRQQMEAGGFLVLFDGLSEIESERSAAFTEIIARVSDEKMKGCRFIFTSRPIQQLPPEVPAFVLQPLTIEAIKGIYLPCNTSLTEARKTQVLRQLAFFGNKPVEPLLFNMAIQDSIDETISTNRAELFEKYFRRLLNVFQNEKETIWLGWRRALETLADWFMLSTGKRAVGLPHKVLLEKMLGLEDGKPTRPNLAEQMNGIYGIGVKNNLDLLERLLSAGFLKGRLIWTFRLDAFEEFFAASRIISAVKDGENILLDHWHKDDEDLLGTIQFAMEMARPETIEKFAKLDLPSSSAVRFRPEIK